ncbi:MAG: NADPH-dependent F420 reductase [Pirellulaceae bacterium]
MKIAILGTGRVGGTLGRRWSQGGHHVVFGSRTPEDARVKQLLAECGENAEAVSLAQAVQAADVVIMALPWHVAQEELSKHDFDGKVLVDCTNPLNAQFTGLDLGFDTSAAEAIAAWAKGARVVKAFNTVSSAAMADPTFDGQPAAMFYCGDDEQAKAIVGSLAGELGFDAVDAGDLKVARLIEPLAMLYIHMAVNRGWGSRRAFRVVERGG